MGVCTEVSIDALSSDRFVAGCVPDSGVQHPASGSADGLKLLGQTEPTGLKVLLGQTEVTGLPVLLGLLGATGPKVLSELTEVTGQPVLLGLLGVTGRMVLLGPMGVTGLKALLEQSETTGLERVPRPVCSVIRCSISSFRIREWSNVTAQAPSALLERALSCFVTPPTKEQREATRNHKAFVFRCGRALGHSEKQSRSGWRLPKRVVQGALYPFNVQAIKVPQ